MDLRLDHLFGHTIERTPEGWVYQDDGSKVDWDNPRSCKGCSLSIARGTHDPCIAGLPETRQACCGHGLVRTPNGNLPGYVALKDGRLLRFTGLSGEEVRDMVARALAGQPLPACVQVDAQLSWWAGLTEAQYQYVWSRLRSAADIERLVAEARQQA